MASSSSSATMSESVFEGLEFFEANNMLLMALMEETQEDQCCEDDRLMNMIQSLEAEISSTCCGDPYYQSYDMEVMGQEDGQDCSTSSIISWEDIEVVSAASSSSPPSSFDEDMKDAWSLCAAGGEDSGDYSSEFYYDGVLLENYLLPQETSDLLF